MIMKKNRLANFLVLGSKWLIMSQLFLFVGGIGCGIFQRMTSDEGILTAICLGLACIFEAIAYFVLEKGNKVTQNDPENTFKVRKYCFYKATLIQGVLLFFYLIFVIFKVLVLDPYSRLIIVSVIVISILLPVKLYYVCIGYLEFAAMKSAKTAKLFKIGSVVFPICGLSLLQAYVLYIKTSYPMAIILTMTVAGLVGLILFMVLLGIFAAGYGDDVNKKKEIRNSVLLMLLIMIGSFVIGALGVTGLNIASVAGEKKAAKKLVDQNITKVMEGPEDAASKYVNIKVGVNDIEDTGEYSIPKFSNYVRYGVFDFKAIFKKFGYTINVYVIKTETGEKMLAVMPSFIIEKVKDEAVNGVITLPAGTYEKIAQDVLYGKYYGLPDMERIAKETGADHNKAFVCLGVYITFDMGTTAMDYENSFFRMSAIFFIILFAGLGTLLKAYARRMEKKLNGEENLETEAVSERTAEVSEENRKVASRTFLILMILVCLLTLPIAVERIETMRIENGTLVRSVYDENNVLVYRRAENLRYYREFDENGNAVFVEESGKDVTKYDSDGNMIFRVLLEDFVEKWDYNEYGDVIKYEHNLGTVTYRNEYDEKQNLIRQEGSNGKWTRFEYNANGNLICREDSDGKMLKYKYDDKGRLILVVSRDGGWTEYGYDENGNEVLVKTSRGDRLEYAYDANGRKISFKKTGNSGISGEEWYKYDSHGNLKRKKAINGDIVWYRNKYMK